MLPFEPHNWPFLLYIFTNSVLHFYPGWHWLRSSYLCFLPSWDDRCTPPQPAFIDWERVSWTFYPGWPWTFIFPISTSSSEDYRCESPHPTKRNLYATESSIPEYAMSLFTHVFLHFIHQSFAVFQHIDPVHVWRDLYVYRHFIF
jgi:hypothetical protein